MKRLDANFSIGECISKSVVVGELQASFGCELQANHISDSQVAAMRSTLNRIAARSGFIGERAVLLTELDTVCGPLRGCRRIDSAQIVS